MNFESGRHCSVMRLIGVPLGLWPYRCTILHKINGAIALTIIVLFLAAQLLAFPLRDDLLGPVKGIFSSRGYLQLAVFLTHEVSADLFLKCVTSIIPPSLCVLKYSYFMWKMDQVKYIFEWIQNDYDSMANESELRLTGKHADRGKSISNFALYSSLLIFVPIGLTHLAGLFNIETFVNQAHSVQLPVKVEYFVDQHRYFYWIILHLDATTVLGVSIVFVTESACIHFVIHACGLLEVVGDRVERVLESSSLNVFSAKTDSSIHDQLVATVRLHQRALKFIEYLNTSFLQQYCILIVIGVVSLSINLYILARGVLLMKVTSDMLIALVLVIAHFIYMGVGNYIGQIVLDNGDDLFTKTYYGRWHESALPVQKMILYIRQRSMQPTGLVFGGLYAASLEFLSKLMNTSMSYFMVIYSTA